MDKDDPRYNKVHEWGNARFTLKFFEPHQDECKFLLMKVVEQAVRDYVNLENSSIPIEQSYYESAEGFLFDDDYRIEYGGQLMSFTDVLDCLNMEAIWFREKITDIKARKKRKQK